MVSSKSPLLLCLLSALVAVQPATSFSGPAIAPRVQRHESSSSSPPVSPSSAAMGRFHRSNTIIDDTQSTVKKLPLSTKKRSKRRMLVLEVVKQTPKRSKRFLGILGTAIALWRGPMGAQPAVAARKAPTAQEASMTTTNNNYNNNGKDTSSSRTKKVVVTGSGTVLVMAGGWQVVQQKRKNNDGANDDDGDDDDNDDNNTTIGSAQSSESIDLPTKKVVEENDQIQADPVVVEASTVSSVEEVKENPIPDSTPPVFCEEFEETEAESDENLFEQLYDAKQGNEEEEDDDDESAEEPELEPIIDEVTRKRNEMQAEWEMLQQEADNTPYPLSDEQYVEARRQPKPTEVEEKLLEKYYHLIENPEDRAFQILLDLGMIEESKPVDIEKFNEILSGW